MLNVIRDPLTNKWIATWGDDAGQLGESVTGVTRDYALVFLGLEMGKNPSKFLRPMSKYFKEIEEA